MAKTDIEKQIDEETEQFNNLNANIQNAEQQLIQARKELDVRAGRISILQEQLQEQEQSSRKKPAPKKES